MTISKVLRSGIVDTYMALRPLSADDLPPGARRHVDNSTAASSVGYMFKSSAVRPDQAGLVGAELLVPEMDRFGIEKAMIEVKPDDAVATAALASHRDRFIAAYKVNPNLGTEGVRNLERAVRDLGVRAATASPSFYEPPVPINDKKFYPLYAKCEELGIPIFLNSGIPGPRIPFEAQYVGHFDEVCWFFPQLKIVMRHGAEPWVDLAIKLLLKWPNLYFCTSAFAPKHYPPALVDYMNKRGADKVMYAGYFPIALSLDRVFAELPQVPFRDHVWPKFLRDNAHHVLGLE